jgi:hypothetical protein
LSVPPYKTRPLLFHSKNESTEPHHGNASLGHELFIADAEGPPPDINPPLHRGHTRSISAFSTLATLHATSDLPENTEDFTMQQQCIHLASINTCMGLLFNHAFVGLEQSTGRRLSRNGCCRSNVTRKVCMAMAKTAPGRLLSLAQVEQASGQLWKKGKHFLPPSVPNSPISLNISNKLFGALSG